MVLTAEGENFIHMGAGNDVIVSDFSNQFQTAGGSNIHYGDASKDIVIAGSGDDIIVAYGNDSYGADVPFAVRATDYYSGGDGTDVATVILGRFVNEFKSGDDEVTINIHDQFGAAVFSDYGVSGKAGHEQFSALLDAYFTNLYDNPGDTSTIESLKGKFIDRIEASAIVYNHGVTGFFASTKLFSDVEAVGAQLSSGSSNIALFTGATGKDAYVGSATSKESTHGTIDTFVADFSRTIIHKRINVQSGEFAIDSKVAENVELDFSSAETVSTVRGSQISGFDRMHVIGTTGNDVLIGSGEESRSDYIDGFDGDDYLDGGDDLNEDVLIGGKGSDVVVWSNDGLDSLYGGLLDGSDRDADLDWLILGDITDTSVDGGLTFRSRAEGDLRLFFSPIFQAGDTSAQLQGILTDLEDQVQFEVGYGHARGVNYQGFERVNVVGSDAFDDLAVYQNGAFYDFGERDGDADVFVGSFAGTNVGITFNITDDSPDKLLLENGAEIRGVDRAILVGSDARDNSSGGSLNDVFFGGKGDDHLMGGGGDDALFAGAGDDVVRWRGLGDVTADGGAGSDNLVIGGPEDDLDEAISWRVFDEAGEAITPLLKANDDSFTLFGAAFEFTGDQVAKVKIGGHSIEYEGFEAVSVIGSSDFADLFFYDGGLLYVGGEGSAIDTFAARLDTEADLSIRADGLDGTGAETASPIFYDIGNGGQIAGMDRLVLLSGLGNDHLVGGNSAEGDLISGGSGNDTIDGALSLNDNLIGNTGDDTVVARNSVGSVAEGNEGTDTLYATLQGTSYRTLADTHTVVGATYSADSFTLADATVILGDLIGSEGSEYINIAGTSETALLKAMTFEHVNLITGDGADFLMAASGASVLYAGRGKDVLFPRSGDDILVGEEGDDTYVFSGMFGNDVVAPEDIRGGTLMFADSLLADLVFSADGTDLLSKLLAALCVSAHISSQAETVWICGL